MQFEITAVFALAIADIHGMDLDKDQALALVYGLSNERVSQKQIATMATDLSSVSAEGVVAVGNKISAGRGDWSTYALDMCGGLERCVHGRGVTIGPVERDVAGRLRMSGRCAIHPTSRDPQALCGACSRASRSRPPRSPVKLARAA